MSELVLVFWYFTFCYVHESLDDLLCGSAPLMPKRMFCHSTILHAPLYVDEGLKACLHHCHTGCVARRIRFRNLQVLAFGGVVATDLPEAHVCFILRWQVNRLSVVPIA